MPEALKAELQKLANADRRKLGPYILIVLEEHVAAKKAAAKKSCNGLAERFEVIPQALRNSEQLVIPWSRVCLCRERHARYRV